MPLYELKCTNEKCNHNYEKRIPLSEVDTHEAKCPVCESTAERVISSMPASHTTWKNWRL